jgi:GTP-binding protein Era
VVLLVLDAGAPIGPGDRLVAERVSSAGHPTVVAVNKVDAADRNQIIEHLAEAGGWGFDAYVPVSALAGSGLEALLSEVVPRLPDGPMFFPPDVTTDQAEQIMVGEVVREKFLERLRDELPHSLVVRVISLEERPGGLLAIEARAIVERRSQKGIVIGKGGSMLRAAGEEARLELEARFGTPIYLDLRVQVEPDWQSRPELLDRLGFEEQ